MEGDSDTKRESRGGDGGKAVEEQPLEGSADDDCRIVVERMNIENMFSQEEIVRKIIVNLHPNDLLRTRLVSHLWNKLSVEFLWENDAIKQLCSKPSFVTELFDTKTLQTSLERFETHIVNPDITCLKQFEVLIKGDAGSTVFGGGLDKSFNCVERLTKLFGTDCVKFFGFNGDFSSRSTVQTPLPKLVEVLNYVSGGVEEIRIGEMVKLISQQGLTEIAKLSFPKLKELICALSWNTTLLIQIVNGAPKLEVLVLIRNLLDFLPSTYGMRQEQAVTPDLPGLELRDLGHLKYLTVDFFDDKPFNRLKATAFNNLETLHFQLIHSMPESIKEAVPRFLETKCQNLTYLQLSYYQNVHDPLGTVFLNLPTLPTLRGLDYNMKLSLRFQFQTHFGFINVKEFSTALPPPHLKFPALTMVTTHFGIHLIAKTESDLPDGIENKSWYNNPIMLNYMEFPSVTTLNYTLPASTSVIPIELHSTIGKCCCSLPENINQLRLLYPNVKELIVNNRLSPLLEDRIKILLTLLLQEFGDTLEKLIISNYCVDWLPEVLDANPELVIKLQGLKVVKFGRPGREVYDDLTVLFEDKWSKEMAKNGGQAEQPNYAPTVLNLMKYLPNIAEYHVNPIFLQRAIGQPGSDSKLTPKEALAEKYPQLKVVGDPKM